MNLDNEIMKLGEGLEGKNLDIFNEMRRLQKEKIRLDSRFDVYMSIVGGLNTFFAKKGDITEKDIEHTLEFLKNMLSLLVDK